MIVIMKMTDIALKRAKSSADCSRVITEQTYNVHIILHDTKL